MPGPSPSYQPCFPVEFLTEARLLSRRRTVLAHLRQRARLAVLLHERPDISNVAAGSQVGLHPNSVRLWRQRWAQGHFDLEDLPGPGRKPTFSPLDRAAVTALACEQIAQTKTPLSRQSLGDLARIASDELGKPVSRWTIGRILDEDAIKPWQYEHWIFPRAADFFDKAAVVLDLYEGRWQGERLGLSDYVISSDEKTSIQARVRCADTLPPGPGRTRRVEHEYQRGGALQYLAGWDVQRGVVTGRCEASTGIEPFGRLVKQVMEQEPYRSAQRVFWVVDNGSSHRGEAARRRMLSWYGNAILVNTPVHASWLNQVEIYFSIVQRKILTPNDFADLAEVELRLRLYEELSNSQPRPFNWRFTKADLFDLLHRLAAKEAAAGQQSGNRGNAL